MQMLSLKSLVILVLLESVDTKSVCSSSKFFFCGRRNLTIRNLFLTIKVVQIEAWRICEKTIVRSRPVRLSHRDRV